MTFVIEAKCFRLLGVLKEAAGRWRALVMTMQRARLGEQTSALVATQTGGASTPLNHKSSWVTFEMVIISPRTAAAPLWLGSHSQSECLYPLQTAAELNAKTISNRAAINPGGKWVFLCWRMYLQKQHGGDTLKKKKKILVLNPCRNAFVHFPAR